MFILNVNLKIRSLSMLKTFSMRTLLFIGLLTSLIGCDKEDQTPKAPDCKITKMASNGDIKHPVIYGHGDTIMKIGEIHLGYVLYFDEKGKLLRKESPTTNPYYRTDLVYNNLGQVIELRYYGKQFGKSWEYEAKRSFTYDKGKLVKISDGYDYEINWQGNDIKSVIHRFRGQVDCIVTFTYDGLITNPNHQFNYFYFVDQNTNDVNYKLPYYFSQHLPTTQVRSCAIIPDPSIFSYTFAPNGLIESVLHEQSGGIGFIWEYEYGCKM